jgi:uncharacterized protein YPO0396
MGPWFVLADAAASNYALALLVGVSAAMVGYAVFRLVPEDHYPRMAGWLASNVIVAALALIGVEVAAEIVTSFFLMSGLVVLFGTGE